MCVSPLDLPDALVGEPHRKLTEAAQRERGLRDLVRGPHGETADEGTAWAGLRWSADIARRWPGLG